MFAHENHIYKMWRVNASTADCQCVHPREDPHGVDDAGLFTLLQVANLIQAYKVSLLVTGYMNIFLVLPFILHATWIRITPIFNCFFVVTAEEPNDSSLKPTTNREQSCLATSSSINRSTTLCMLFLVGDCPFFNASSCFQRLLFSSLSHFLSAWSSKILSSLLLFFFSSSSGGAFAVELIIMKESLSMVCSAFFFQHECSCRNWGILLITPLPLRPRLRPFELKRNHKQNRNTRNSSPMLLSYAGTTFTQRPMTKHLQ